MVPKIYEEIDSAVAQGVKPEEAARLLIQKGWPEKLVNEVAQSWMVSHGRKRVKSDFGEWIKIYKKKALLPIITTVSFSVIVSLISLLKPWPTKIMVDSAFGDVQAPGPLASYSQTPELILITSIMTVIIFASAGLVGVFRDYLLIKLGFKINQEIKEKTLSHILNIPSSKSALSKGDYIYRQNSLTGSVADYILGVTSSIMQSFITVVCILIIMLYLNAPLTIICVLLLPSLYFMTKLIMPKVTGFARNLAKNNSSASSLITESVDNSEIVQSYDMVNRQIEKANRLWYENYSLTIRGLFFGRSYKLLNGLIVIIATSAVMYLGGVAALSNKITLGELLIFMTYTAYLMAPVQNLANQLALKAQKKIDVSRVHDVLTEYEGIENSWEYRHFPIRDGLIEFQSVGYAYNNLPVLKNINLNVSPGEKIGIIGPSGCGKSTFLKLLSLLLEPTEGKIMVDNIDIQTVSLKELRKNIAYAGQSPQLFNSSVLDNVLDGSVNHQMDREYQDDLIKSFGLDELARLMPDGLNTLVGEGGNKLSGGQKQRVALARAFAKQTKIICMDEPTSSLDNKSEDKLKNTIGHLLKGRTVFLASHRKSLLTLMDKIYVIENGSLVDVNQMGGLDVYLSKIDTLDEQNEDKKEEQEKLKLMERIQQEKEKEMIKEAMEANKAQHSNEASSMVDDVAVVINH